MLSRVLSAASAAIVMSGSPEGLPPTPPYLQNGQPGEITVMWRDRLPSAATVSLTDDWGQPAARAEVAPAAQQEVTLRGLTPGEVYRYEVVEAGRVIGRGRFRLNRGPEADHLRFAVIGDMGSGDAAQYAIARQLTRWAPEFTLAVGDIIYPRGEGPLYGPRFFAPYAELLRHAVIYPALGNHDVLTHHGEPYLQAFSLPQEPGNERYYAFDNGPARFWCLDSTQSLAPGSPQYEWFKADAAASRASWKFAYFHHPLYSSGFHGSSLRLRRYLEPIFVHNHFSVVFSGHDHDYERSEPIHGVTYVVTGGGGATIYGMRAPSAFTAYEAPIPNFVGMTIYQGQLALFAVNEQGRVFDTCLLRRPGSD